MINFIKLPTRPSAQAPRREPVLWRALVGFLALGATGAAIYVACWGDGAPAIVRVICGLVVVLGLLLYRDAMTRKDL